MTLNIRGQRAFRADPVDGRVGRCVALRCGRQAVGVAHPWPGTMGLPPFHGQMTASRRRTLRFQNDQQRPDLRRARYHRVKACGALGALGIPAFIGLARALPVGRLSRAGSAGRCRHWPRCARARPCAASRSSAPSRPSGSPGSPARQRAPCARPGCCRCPKA